MNKMKLIIAVLALALILESTLFASIYLSQTTHTASPPQNVQILKKSFEAGFNVFNQPISNDTEFKLDQGLERSWEITVQSHLVPSQDNLRGTEAQIAIAPEYHSENLSIPTIIVQERGDGLLRIEYFAQNWNNSYGLVLYNSTSPTWTDGQNITLIFLSYGPPAQVNPQIAPYPNGNLTIVVGSEIVVSNYPIAWANLSDFYIYGLKGSSFVNGVLTVTVYEVRSGG
ncbi:MAG: hypothetical protein ABSD99_05985 [Candidatus Bathyarchaeia archaeon]